MSAAIACRLLYYTGWRLNEGGAHLREVRIPNMEIVATKVGGSAARMATNNANSSTKEYQVLQKYYSKLIRTIADPVRIAADLFSANLISEETRIKANNENSNLDTRNSYLLDGLTRAVAIDPTNLTKIISVLECHPPLLSLIAEEMKTECGNIIYNAVITYKISLFVYIVI